MPAPTATHPGVDRSEAMAGILKAREAQIDQELKEGGTLEGIAALERPDSAEATDTGGAMPEGTDPAEWAKLDDTTRAALVEADAERKKAEASEGETDEQRAAREQKEAADRKASEAGAASQGTQPKKVKIKVDGQDMEVDESVLVQAGIRTMQKETAADKRLEEASRLFKEATAAVAAAQGGAVQDPNKSGASLPAQGGGAAEVLTDQAYTDAVKKIQYGSEAEAAAVLKDLITRAASSGQPEQLTLDRVAEMLDFREATRWAHDEYKEILGDPKLKVLFSTEEKRLRAAGDMRPYREIYTDIGNGLREWLKGVGPSQQKQQASGTNLQQRHERKASVVVIPSAASRQPAPTQQKEPTPSEVVDRMRKVRHQA